MSNRELDLKAGVRNSVSEVAMHILPDDEPLIFTHPREVLARELDPVYKHVHHAQSLRFLEEARLKYLEAVGCPNNELIDSGILIVIAQIAVAYKREIFAGPIMITVEEPRIEGKALLLDQRIVNAKGKECLQATLDLRCMSATTKRAILPPDDLARRFLGEVGERSESA